MKENNNNLYRNKKIVLHPYFFAIFPIFSLFDRNKDLVSISCLLLPLTISVLFILIFMVSIRFFIKDKIKTGILISAFVFLFFFFGHLINYLEIRYVSFGEIIITTTQLLLFLWINILFVVFSVIIKNKQNLFSLNKILNIVSIALIVIPLTSMASYYLITKNFFKTSNLAENLSFSKKTDKLPDIYYIILDGYARGDVLKQIYDYDNSSFLGYLSNKGFYIGHESRSNYAQSYLSMTSSLNFDYIPNLNNNLESESEDRNFLKTAIANNSLFKVLKKNGYLIVAVPGTWEEDSLNEDIRIKPSFIYLNDFTTKLIGITPISPILPIKKIQLMLMRKNLIDSIRLIPEIAEIDQPTFVYAHILSPHPPFLFGKNGEPVIPSGMIVGTDGSHYFKYYPGPQKYRKQYRDQVNFLNTLVREMIDEILEKSINPPVIILQSDHGPGSLTDWEDHKQTDMKERLSILNAYHVPENWKTDLYPSITPVNTFRVINNNLFGSQLEILPDNSYFSEWNKPYNFIDVTDLLKSND